MVAESNGNVTIVAEEKKPMTLVDIFALSVWMGVIHLTVLALLLVFFNFPSPWAIYLLIGMVTLLVIPVYRDSWLARTVCSFICRRAIKYFPITVIIEDEQALKSSQPCVVGFEPHSILPVGTAAMSRHSPLTPLPGLSCAATSALFWSPFMRHLWGWMGLIPATKEHLKKLLRNKESIAVIPGGVQECLYMEHGVETVYLRQRKGFVKLAAEEGASIVPVFVFGQTFTYKWWRPSGKWYNNLARHIGFAPLIFWGKWGTFIPLPTPMTVIVGKPISTTDTHDDEVSFHDKVDMLHKKFVSEMERIFLKYRKQSGYKDLKLIIL